MKIRIKMRIVAVNSRSLKYFPAFYMEAPQMLLATGTGTF